MESIKYSNFKDLTRYKLITAAKGIRLTDWCWVFVFSAGGGMRDMTDVGSAGATSDNGLVDTSQDLGLLDFPHCVD
jgi:hypothetical protein